MEPDPELVKPLLTPLLTISNRDFTENMELCLVHGEVKTYVATKCNFALAHFKGGISNS